MIKKNIINPLWSAIQWFDSISLEDLNNSMALMERKETKFLLSLEQLPQLISCLQEKFSVLTIKDTNIFNYDNVYLDTQDYKFYHQHEWWKKIRTKVRTRQYVDSNIQFFEYKQRNKWQISKYRYELSAEEHWKITLEWMKFFQKIYTWIYNTPLQQLIVPSLKNSYNRITFCSKNNDERITIDYNLQFTDPVNPTNTYLLKNIAIIESKAATQPAPSASIFKALNIKKHGACSKYCLWLIHLNKVDTYNHFQKTLDSIQSLQTQNIGSEKKSVETIHEAVQEFSHNVS